MAAHPPSPILPPLSQLVVPQLGVGATQTPRHSSLEQGSNQHLLPGQENHTHTHVHHAFNRFVSQVLFLSESPALPDEMTFTCLFVPFISPYPSSCLSLTLLPVCFPSLVLMLFH